jgi:site-specific DNA-cytosine methylase
MAHADSNDEYWRRGHVQVGRQRRKIQAANDGAPGGNERRTEPGLGGVVDGLPDWAHEPSDVPRVAAGVRDRSARLKALGNAVVPQCVELIGRAIMQAEGLT